ncbi:MAG: hemolysin family protein [Fidelibacterota bacterium]
MSILITFFLLALGISFLCSLLEAVILSVTHSHIGVLIKEKHRTGELLLKLKNDINSPLAAILTLNTIANTVGATVVGAQTLKLFGSGKVAIASAVLTFCILVFSEIIPKTLGATYWRKLAAPAAYTVQVLIWFTYPFVWLSGTFSKRLRDQKGQQKKVSRAEITAMAELGEDEGTIEEHESTIIENLFQLKRLTAEDILTPRGVIFAFNKDATVQEVLEKHDEIIFSRIPIFGRDLDDILGIIYKDTLLEAMADDKYHITMAELAEPVDTVFEKQSVEAILDKFIKKRSHMFVVKDEFGGTSGLITLEDCIETLLGVEIMDESDSVADMRELAKDQQRQKRKSGLAKEKKSE